MPCTIDSGMCYIKIDPQYIIRNDATRPDRISLILYYVVKIVWSFL